MFALSRKPTSSVTPSPKPPPPRVVNPLSQTLAMSASVAGSPRRGESEQRGSYFRSSGTHGRVLQRKCAECSSEEQLQRKCARCSGEEHREEASRESGATPAVVDETLRAGGTALDPAVRAYFEPRFGQDFSGVRVHTDARADASARAVDAVAYTVGQSVVFRSGAFAPETGEGKRLLAHELAHVVQQRTAGGAGPVQAARTQMAVSQPGDPSEQEADRAADAVVGGESGASQARFEPRASVGPMVQREPPAGGSSENEPTKEEIKAALADQNAKDRATAGALRAKYEGIAKTKLEAAKPDFSGLGLDKEHHKVDAKNTPLTDEEVVKALRSAWRKVFGKEIPSAALPLLIAQWRTEGGKKGIFNYNIGNITLPKGKGTATAPSDPISDYSVRTAKENIPGEGIVDKTQSYAAYDSLEQGAMALIHHVVSGRPALWAALESGNLRDYIYVLKSHGYFTAPVEDVVVKGKKIPGYLTTSKATVPKPGDPLLTAEPAPASPPPAASKGTPSPTPGKPMGACETACRAFQSMQNSAEGICRLDGEDGTKCADARKRVVESSKRIQDAGCTC